jgi:hypothetical protein
MSLLATLTPGRTYDVMAFRGQVASGFAPLSQDFLAAGGQVGTGKAKLAQWFVATLLTDAGSKPYDLAAGTTFLAKLRTGQLRTETAVFVAYGFAVGDILAQARAVQTAATPPYEMLVSAPLTSVTLSGGVAVLAITISTAAGASVPVILPIPVA